MTVVQSIGLFFAILGIISSIFGIQVILNRAIKKEISRDISNLKEDIIRQIRENSTIPHASH